ncbi:SH3 domain-containing protein [Myxococcota bacterium]|nr:SH3 domain-containing protein [Myxococcota bacterium]
MKSGRATRVAALVVLRLAAGAVVATAAEDSPEQVFDACNRLYDAGDYEQAASCYDSLVARGIRNGHLFYDLGNARYRLGDLGGSILAWRHAGIDLPRDGDLAANIETARKQRKDALASPEAERSALRRTLLFWYDGLSPRELWTAAVCLNVLLWTLAAARLFRRSERLTFAVAAAAVLTAAFLGGAVVRSAGMRSAPPGVVLLPEATVRSGRDRASTDLFKLHEGAEVTVRKRDSGWLLVELPDGKRGWVDEGAVGIVEW